MSEDLLFQVRADVVLRVSVIDLVVSNKVSILRDVTKEVFCCKVVHDGCVYGSERGI
jgi:hypothetical protein